MTITVTFSVGEPRATSSVTAGQRSGRSATWTMMSGLVVSGTFTGDEFDGTALFQGALSLNVPSRTTSIHLNVTGRDL